MSKFDTMRVLVTEKCNMKCPNCFNIHQRSKKEINVDLFSKLAQYLSSNGIKRIKLMGGEPTIHSQFEEIYSIAQDYFDVVILFSNGLSPNIEKISPRESDIITYNGQFIFKKMRLSRLLLDKPGKRNFETQIASNIDVHETINNYSAVFKRIQSILHTDILKKKLGILLTLNCTENIFANQVVLAAKWNLFFDFVSKTVFPINFDHPLPICFIFNNKLKIKQNNRQCNTTCSGLIDSNLTLRYCNQFPVKLIDIMINNKFIPFDMVKMHLKIYNCKIIMNNFKKGCFNCPKFTISCNGGCYVGKEFISSSDIKNALIMWSNNISKSLTT
jgi:hypothetical protein